MTFPEGRSSLIGKIRSLKKPNEWFKYLHHKMSNIERRNGNPNESAAYTSHCEWNTTITLSHTPTHSLLCVKSAFEGRVQLEFQVDRFFPICRGVDIIADYRIIIPAPEIRLSEIRTQLNRFSIVRNCTVIIIYCIIGVCPRIVGIGKLWIQFYRLVAV